jgi:serine/threonine protein kinase
MGEVFLGASPGGRKVAVKLIHPVHARDTQFRERFAREIEAAQRVGGFHTALVVDADPHADPPWMVTAYIEGPSLQEAVSQDGPLPPGRVRALGAGLAEGLAAIHVRGLVHRDLKPGNVIMAADGPRIIDFGIARSVDASTAITTTGAVVGTLAYMSPEQIRGEVAGSASDVFSLGSVLGFAATGRPPFGSDSAVSIMFRVVNQSPDLAGVADAKLRELIAGCLAKSPRDRPPVRVILAALSSEVPVPTAASAPAGAVPLSAGNSPSTQTRPPMPAGTGPDGQVATPPASHGPGPPRTGVARSGAPPNEPARSRPGRRSRGRRGRRSRRQIVVIATIATVVAALAAVLPFLLSGPSPRPAAGHGPGREPSVSGPATTPGQSSASPVTAKRSRTPGPTSSTTTVAPPTAASNPAGGSVFSRQFGTHSSLSFTLDVFGQAEKAGQPIILFRTAKADSAQHWIVPLQGTTANFYAAGRVGVAVAQHYGCIPRVNFPNCYGQTADTVNDPAFEIEYAPNNVASGLCMGVASTAVQGGVVTLQPCGVSARTVWIADTFGSPSTLSNGYVPLINGSDTNFSQPFVLTYPQSGYPTDMPRPQLQVDKITGRSRFAAEPELGTVDSNQLWGADFSTG